MRILNFMRVQEEKTEVQQESASFVSSILILDCPF